MKTPSYAYAKQLADVSFDDARTRVGEALKNQGFGVLTEIDVKATLKQRLDVDFRPYVILGACNPRLAHRALEADPHLGLMLPCNVVVQETDRGALVSIANPRAMFGLVDNRDLEPIVAEADERLRRVLAHLG